MMIVAKHNYQSVELSMEYNRLNLFLLRYLYFYLADTKIDFVLF